MVLCDNCNDEIATQKHHKKYFPEETVPLCDPCHKLIHTRWFAYLTEKYIKYAPGDSKLFYTQMKRVNGFLHYLTNKKKKHR